jgi:hypothetical protein
MVPYLPLTATAWLENAVELGEERSITGQGVDGIWLNEFTTAPRAASR